MHEAPKIAFIELSFRVDFRLNCIEMIKQAVINEDEQELLRIAIAFSKGEYVFDDEETVQIDRSKVSIPLKFTVIFQFYRTPKKSVMDLYSHESTENLGTKN